jgi:hypothetical protein
MENEIRAGPEISEDVSYIFFVYGIVPEFMPHFAFRREKHFTTVGRKIIKCPYCRKTFTTVDETEKIELYQYSRKEQVICHETMPCKTCHKQVGIIYAIARPA